MGVLKIYILVFCIVLLGQAFAQNNTYQEAFPWRNSYIGRTMHLPRPFIIVHNFKDFLSSPTIDEINRLALKAELTGRPCGRGESDPHFLLFNVESVLPAKTSFTIKKAFITARQMGWGRSLFLKLLSLKGIGIRGDHSVYYYIAEEKDSKKNFVIHEQRVHEELSYLYNTEGMKKAHSIINRFPSKGPQTILMKIETYREYFRDKCRYSNAKDINLLRNWPRKAFKAIVKFAEEHPEYLLKNAFYTKKGINITVNKQSLSLLILNSQNLSLKDINMIF